MRLVGPLTVGLGLLLCPLPASASMLLGVAWDGSVVTVDAGTGTQTVLGASGFSGLNSLARNSTGGFFTVAGDPLLSFGQPSTLVSINPTTGTGAAVTSLATLPSGSVRALAFAADDTLYAIVNGGGPTGTGVSDALYTINVATGTAAQVGTTSFPGLQGLAFAPGGTLFGWDVNTGLTGGGLVTLNPADATGADLNAALGEAGADIQSIAFAPDGTLFGGRTALYVIDPTTGAPTAVGAGGLADLRGLEWINDPADSTDPPEGPHPFLPEPASGILLGTALLGTAVVRRARGTPRHR